MKSFLIDGSPRLGAFIRWVESVERHLGDECDAEGLPLMISASANNAFDEGVTASDYALDIKTRREERSFA
jgi:hypothetical protein